MYLVLIKVTRCCLVIHYLLMPQIVDSPVVRRHRPRGHGYGLVVAHEGDSGLPAIHIYSFEKQNTHF